MLVETSGKTELLVAISDAVSQLQDLMASLDEEKLNTVPYTDSWTAGQLFRHVTKSMTGMSKALVREGQPAERDAGERIGELKEIFLDFSIKLKSPDFVVPDVGPYKKQVVIDDLNSSFSKLKENANEANLSDLINDLPFGPITKLEIIHFVLYHTQRHLHQMTKICDAL